MRQQNRNKGITIMSVKKYCIKTDVLKEKNRKRETGRKKRNDQDRKTK